MGFLITSISGFLALFLVLLTLALPYVLRAQARRGGSQAVAAWQRMHLHYWIGYAVLTFSVVHMYVAMGAGVAHRTNIFGLDLATLGLLLILVQVMLGVGLRTAGSSIRSGLRRLHFVIMTGIVAMVLAHLALNSVLMREFL